MIIKILFIGAVIIAFNLVIQALGSTFWLRKVVNSIKSENDISNNKIFKISLFTFLFFTLIHTFHSLVWAFSYSIIPETASQFVSFSESFYFSIVTFTTLGYGDISLSTEWRLLSGLEAINGIMLIGWSTAMMFSLFQNIYKKINAN